MGWERIVRLITMIPKWLRQCWHFIWEEDSLASWIANVVLAFIIIKFVVYPGLGFLFATTHPIVAVVSGSMEHDGGFDQWWNSSCGSQSQSDFYREYGISKQQFSGFLFKNGFDKGDIMVVHDGSNPGVGDVIIYTIPDQADPIIHRVVTVTPSDNSQKGHNLYKTKGDHNCGINGFEEAISQNQVLGKAWIRVPWLGWVKLAFMKLISKIGLLIGG